jgi:hypothetical protein
MNLRSLVILLLLGASAYQAKAQVVEINPSVEWRYIRSQKMEIQEDNVYKYEFPAEKGYDYIFSFLTDQSGLYTYLKIYDLQMKPIAKVERENAPQSTALEFNVSHSATYIVEMGYSPMAPAPSPRVNFDFTLIRRPIVAK